MNEFSLPLFLHVTDPLAIIVVNDSILIHERSAGTTLYPYRALELLIQLYNTSTGKESVPDIFHPYFENNEFKQIIEKTNCLVGVDENLEPGALYLCFNVEMDITQIQEKNIVLKNLTYQRENLSYKVKISTSDAFFILTNICVEQKLNTFFKYYDPYSNPIFDSNFLKYSNQSSSTRLLQFLGEYIDFMKVQIISGDTDLHTILKLGGIPLFEVLYGLDKVCDFIENAAKQLIVNCNSLSKTDKILFYSLARCMWVNSKVEFNYLDKLFIFRKDVVKDLIYELWPLYPSPLSDWLDRTPYL